MTRIDSRMEIALDSRTDVEVEVLSPHMDSAPPDRRMEIEVALPYINSSYYAFIIEGNAMHDQLTASIEGIYVISQPVEYLSDIDSQLDLEFQAWDILSDEALINFERELG